jgi:ribosomal-protein-alanine N-acetyltransferase
VVLPVSVGHNSGMEETPTLRGKRVLLRPVETQDFGAWQEIRQRNRQWLTQWEPRREAGSVDPSQDEKAFAVRCRSRQRERQLGVGWGFGVFVEDALVGEININNVVRGAFQSAHVGYWVDEKQAGQGYTPEALAVLLRFAFDVVGLHRIQISIVPRNVASRRVVEKLDLRCEGLAERYLEISGTWEDHLKFAFTAEEWAVRREEFARRWLEV